MRALHFGAGNIGRGFIGKNLSEAGVDVVFADVVTDLISLLKERKSFPVRVVGEGIERVDTVTIAGAVLSNIESEILPELLQADLVTTAVGPRILERIAPTIAKGLKARYDSETARDKYVNIIACENAIKATSGLKAHVMTALETLEGAGSSRSADLLSWTKKMVGFADCAVDRIVPPAKEEDPLGVTVEVFSEWVVDRTQLVGPLAEAATGSSSTPLGEVIFTDNLIAFIERKLLTVNTGHALCAYYGRLFGHTEIGKAIRDPQVRQVVEGGMNESGNVLIAKYGSPDLSTPPSTGGVTSEDAPPPATTGASPATGGSSTAPKGGLAMTREDQKKYIEKIIKRFENPFIVDEVDRVGREPLRKLSSQERLVKPLVEALGLGLPYDNLLLGVASALLYQNPQDPQAVKLQQTVEQFGLVQTFVLVSSISNDLLSTSLLPQLQHSIDVCLDIQSKHLPQAGKGAPTQTDDTQGLKHPIWSMEGYPSPNNQ